jgi:hypothetical protein
MSWPRAFLSVLGSAVCASASGAQQPVPSLPQPPVIVSFAINDTATTVSGAAAAITLVHATAGARPVEYRVSARADFANALWLPYATPLRLTGWQGLVQHGAKCDGGADGQRLLLFLQVRADMGGTVHIVNGQRVMVPQKIESNVVSDAICVVPAR